MLLDLHNHTRYSPDSRVDPAELVKLARKIRLAGVAVTDHNSVGGIAAAEQAAGRDFLVIPAIEVSTKSRPVLWYGIRGIVLRVDDVLQLLAQGRTSAQGLDRGPAATARYVTKAVGEWMLRGMRRI